ncbi:MAG TPA: preprotein translocase subunit YajC [Candidatus Eisenbacteria bacterium]|nr:preprotein translocase subunit YajC [Candidatus Eisenbacteria bacterium]
MIQYLPVLLTTDAAPSGGLLVSLLPMILIFGVMYLLMVRPRKKEEQKMRQQIDAMRVGDTVVTIGGIVGKIMNIADDEITISSSVANTMMTFKKQAISTVIQSEENKKLSEKLREESGEPEKKSFFDRFKKNKEDGEENLEEEASEEKDTK